MTHASLINDLEEAIASGDSIRRADTLSRVTDLFISGTEHYTHEQVALFDEVIGRLAEEIEVKARAKLASRLARVANAPYRTMRRLASDDALEVAEPVLAHSPVLRESDLVDTARSKGQGHLLAISRRQALSESVTDVLVTRGDLTVVRTVAGNSGARFSNAGFRALVHRSKADDVLAESVGRRADIPRGLFLNLVEQASASVRSKLLAVHPSANREVNDVMSEVVDRIKSDLRQAAPDYSAALQAMLERRRGGRLSEDDLYAFAQRRCLAETTAALAVMSGLPLEVVQSAMDEETADVVIIIGRACELSWTTVKMILLMRGEKRVSVQDLDRALRGFERLQIGTAKRVVEFYKSRAVQAAVQNRAALSPAKAPRETVSLRPAQGS